MNSIDIFSSTNPAFCALILFSFCEGYSTEAQSDVPYAMLILPIPIILSGDLFESFNGTNAKTGFFSWVKNNPQIQLGLTERIEHSYEFTKPAILFALSKNIIRLNPNATLAPLPENLGNLDRTGNTAILFKHAKRFGSWLGQIKSTKTIFNHLGLHA